MKKFIAIFGLLLALALVAFVIERSSNEGPKTGPSADVATGRIMSIEDYFRLNISALSPIKETLGGTFYVTKVEAHGGAGTVYYEDGHNAYVADFRYSTDEQGKVAVETFQIRK